MKKDSKWRGAKGKEGGSRGTRNRTWTYHPETAGHQHPQTAIRINLLYCTKTLDGLYIYIVTFTLRRKHNYAWFRLRVLPSSFCDERVQEGLIPGRSRGHMASKFLERKFYSPHVLLSTFVVDW
jgi:hypothetical protein